MSASRGAAAALVEVILALSWLVVDAILLGLVGQLRFGWLVATLWASAAVVVAAVRPGGVGDPDSLEEPDPVEEPGQAGGRARAGGSVGIGIWVAIGVVWLVAGQWALSTANALGGGMLSFDGLWYHMPFAAVFARTGSVTGITFTQADPFVAYYPANSELLHALGIVTFRNDFLSPFLNLGWMALELLGAWCVGRRWRVAWWTLGTGALLLALPVLGTTQPGEAFNDIAGLAALVAAVALILAPRRGTLELLAAGLALGLAVGTKYTFLVPAFALSVGVIVTSPRAERSRCTAALAGGLVATGAWWYVRAAAHTGNPLGLAQSLGPLQLPGPHSPLADASQQSVFSEVRHLSLWGSRFAPGLAHAFGPLWPVLLLGCGAAIVAVVAVRREPLLGTIAVATALTAISYLFLPTGATGIQHNTTLFQVNLRYLTPALALALLLAPIVVAIHARRLLGPLAIAVGAVALLAQLERGMWPAQPGRHVAFLAAVAVAMAVARWSRPRLTRSGAKGPAAGAAMLVLVALVAGYVAQHHYFQERYLVGTSSRTGVGLMYRWAQTIAHTRIALYGTVEQYPFYGATPTNVVDYLGQRVRGGGYEPISSCERWQAALAAGHFRYLILTPAPTAAIPLAWSRQDPQLRPVLHPGAGDWIFRVDSARKPVDCRSAS